MFAMSNIPTAHYCKVESVELFYLSSFFRNDFIPETTFVLHGKMFNVSHKGDANIQTIRKLIIFQAVPMSCMTL